jgi:hypothetical protein
LRLAGVADVGLVAGVGGDGRSLVDAAVLEVVEAAAGHLEHLGVGGDVLDLGVDVEGRVAGDVAGHGGVVREDAHVGVHGGSAGLIEDAGADRIVLVFVFGERGV